MEIKEIKENKDTYLDLLLIGDEDAKMIYKYLDKSLLFALFDNSRLVSVCAVLHIDTDTIEIKNLATYPQYQNRGYASKLLNFVFQKYTGQIKNVILGTGENEKTLNFYKKRGFLQTHRLTNFFIDNYPHPIFENGKQLKDMIYLKKFL